MEIFINSLSEKKIDNFINPDMDYFVHIDRQSSDNDRTLDLVINSVDIFTVREDCIVIMFENKKWCKIEISSLDYATIEVM